MDIQRLTSVALTFLAIIIIIAIVSYCVEQALLHPILQLMATHYAG